MMKKKIALALAAMMAAGSVRRRRRHNGDGCDESGGPGQRPGGAGERGRPGSPGYRISGRYPYRVCYGKPPISPAVF